MTTELAKARAEALEAVSNIDGWLTAHEAATLFDLAAHAKGPIVEIGSWRGRSTAALALGSMAGSKQPVYAVDSFKGVPPLDRPTAFGERPGWQSSSPEILRANLDAAGVNGLVKIVPKPSVEAAPEIPECDVLFVDGDHAYEQVLADLRAYLPKVKPGGSVLLHDCCESDMGVVRAVDEVLMPNSRDWLPIRRVHSAMLFQRRTSAKRCRVMLTLPGPTFDWCAVNGVIQASRGVHDVFAANSRVGFDDLNRLWVGALNAAARGECTHVAMLHSDVDPAPGWLDTLIEEMETHKADLVSVALALKDQTGCTSCGIGDAGNPWEPYRRFTVREILAMPPTFSIADTPYPDRYLLHNTGCWVADLRNQVWRTLDENGCLVADMQFPICSRWSEAKGEILHQRESEDWYWSRKMADLRVRSFITRKVSARHVGKRPFPNDEAWGTFTDGDEGTAHKWRKEAGDA